MIIVKYMNEKTGKPFDAYINLRKINNEEKAKQYADGMIKDLFKEESPNLCFLSTEHMFLYEFYGEEPPEVSDDEEDTISELSIDVGSHNE